MSQLDSPVTRIDYNFFKNGDRGLTQTKGSSEVGWGEVGLLGWEINVTVFTNTSHSYNLLNTTRPRHCAYLTYDLNQTQYIRGRN